MTHFYVVVYRQLFTYGIHAKQERPFMMRLHRDAMVRENNVTDWKQGWQYGKGLIYLRQIFRLTELAFLRAEVH